MPEVLYDHAIYVTTSTTVPTSADLLATCTEFAPTESADTVDADYFGSDGYKRKLTTLRDVSATMTLHADAADTIQERLLTAFADGSVVYVWAITDLAAAEGSRGMRYAFKVTGKDLNGNPGEVKTYSLTLAGHGAPVAA